MVAFITLRFLDVLDILLVAFLLYQVYRLIKGTMAFNIVIGLFSLYLVWLVVKALNMELIGSIMGHFVGVGVLALIIVFHPEIRRFLVYIGTNYNLNKVLSLDKLINAGKVPSISDRYLKEIIDACGQMAKSKTGALVILSRKTELVEQINSGEKINGKISSALIQSIFFKNAPLHDGAVIVKGDKIVSARCILPLTQTELKNKNLGLRHRAALGITENSDAIALVVSEERGHISFSVGGKLEENITAKQLSNRLDKHLKMD